MGEKRSRKQKASHLVEEGSLFLLSRMESGRAYDLFPFISAPVKCGFRKAIVVSMVSWATIFEISFFFTWPLLFCSRYPFSRPAYRRERCGVWAGWHGIY